MGNTIMGKKKKRGEKERGTGGREGIKVPSYPCVNS